MITLSLAPARPYGWTGLVAAERAWKLDAYLAVDAVVGLEQLANEVADPDADDLDAVLLRVVDGTWPFPPNYHAAPPWTSDSALGTLLQRRLIALDDHRLFTTTPTFLEFLGLRDLADLPLLSEARREDGEQW